MLTNFPKSKTYNLGGLVGFKFVHCSAVDSWPGIFNSKVSQALLLKPGFEWLTGYSTPETLNFDEPSKETQNGPYYEKIVSGFVPGDKEELLALMEQMDGRMFILIIKDTNGQDRLIGSHGDFLTFYSTYNSGSTRQDQKGYNFKFTGSAIFRAPVYL